MINLIRLTRFCSNSICGINFGNISCTVLLRFTRPCPNDIFIVTKFATSESSFLMISSSAAKISGLTHLAGHY